VRFEDVGDVQSFALGDLDVRLDVARRIEIARLEEALPSGDEIAA